MLRCQKTGLELSLRAALVQYEEEQLRFIKNNLSSPSLSVKWAARGLAQATFLRFLYLREKNYDAV